MESRGLKSRVSCKHRFKFVKRLSEILQNEKLNHIVAWSSDGNSIEIKDSIAFSGEVLPQYYRHNNLTNFIRQLNMYNFKKIRKFDSSELSIVYHNPLFLRDQPNLISSIERKKKDKCSDCEPQLNELKIPSLEDNGNDGIQLPSNNKIYFGILKKEINELRSRINAVMEVNKDLLKDRKKSVIDQSNASSYIESLEFVIGMLYKRLINNDSHDNPNYELIKDICKIGQAITKCNPPNSKQMFEASNSSEPSVPELHSNPLVNRKRTASCDKPAPNGHDSNKSYLSSMKLDIVSHVIDQIRNKLGTEDNLANNTSYNRLKASLCLNPSIPFDVNANSYFKTQMDESNFKKFPHESFCNQREDTLSKTSCLNDIYFDL